MPVRRFERKPGARAEALDALTYATATRVAITLHADQRERELAGAAPPRAPRPAHSNFIGEHSNWMKRS
jgi:phage terminase large subunit GpA-like protein